MGSSSGDDYSTPPQGPPPPANMIMPQGQSTPYQPSFVNFLGDTNQPSTGLTPQMLQQIMASNGPPPGAMPPGGGGMPPQTPQQADPEMRNMLARLQSQQMVSEMQRNPDKNIRNNDFFDTKMPPGQMPHQAFAGRGNRGGWGGSAGGR